MIEPSEIKIPNPAPPFFVHFRKLTNNEVKYSKPTEAAECVGAAT